jgi:hypothetical protein
MKGYFRSLITNNFSLKLLSVALAVLFWMMAKGLIGK